MGNCNVAMARKEGDSAATGDDRGVNYRLFIVDAFAAKPFSGNPAGVLFLDDDPFPSDWFS